MWVEIEVIWKEVGSEVKLLVEITRAYTQTGTSRGTSDGYKLR